MGKEDGEKATVFVANEAVHTARNTEAITLCSMIFIANVDFFYLMFWHAYCTTLFVWHLSSFPS